MNKIALLAVAGVANVASAQVVFDSVWNNGFFTPFNSSTASNVRYGDSGWLGGPGAAPVQLDRIVLGMVAYNGGSAPVAAGTTSISFTFNDGDPSGLVFGPGTTLRSVTVSDVELPALGAGEFGAFALDIPLSGVLTSGNFNNVGWSVGVSNFSYAGSMGFACSDANAMIAGFYTNNASFYNGSNWSLFSFGGNPVTGIAQFQATIYQVPAPGALGVLGLAGLVARRRRG